MGCQVHVGYFLVRVCGEPVVSSCPQCAKELCVGHAAAAGVTGGICAACAAQSSNQAWVDPARATGSASGLRTGDEAEFTESDIAAFDEVTGADRVRGREVYDS